MTEFECRDRVPTSSGPRHRNIDTGPDIRTRQAVTRVAISTLQTSDSPRLGGVNREHVLSLAESGSYLPPILVHRASMRVIDGMHRIVAAQLRGDDTIEVRFFDGGEDEAFVLGVRENISHGLPLTLSDRRAAARRILLIRPHWSDRAIATEAGLSPKTVGSLRRQYSGDQEAAQSRIGRDGRRRPAQPRKKRASAGQHVGGQSDTPVMEAARSVGVSLRSARDVHQQAHRAQEVRSVPLPAPRKEWHPDGPSPRDPLMSIADILRVLRGDPSLRFTENGRMLIRALDAQMAWASTAERLLDNLPPHSMNMVISMATACADTWRKFAEEVQVRKRSLHSTTDKPA
ncbi:ParB/RepB/Spo0J family partition protein [Kutzneria sp. CA-103260]|uniref:ParB/RepB/Spo0J family partition protein n=1 Tax=Kutzneria sp. CA-103260 TaxID=2802641 RepID=UPI001BA8E6F8|nr:ParB/RepB/Spo0J family partition protein [Kutzneria sp. CA-103260]QUQ64973.1 streptomycin biosynthesis operon possible regulatory protein [Kutzneria sp. CA-103260]